MWFPEKMPFLGLLLITLASQLQKSVSTNTTSVNPTTDDKANSSRHSTLTDKQKQYMISAAIHGIAPTASLDFFMMPKPLGPILGMLTAVSEIAHSTIEAYEAPLNYDGASGLMEEIDEIKKNVGIQSQKVTDELTHASRIEKISEMRFLLQSLEDDYNQNMHYILNTTARPTKRDELIRRMLDPLDDHYQKLLTFNIKYILTLNTVFKNHILEPNFFDSVLTTNKYRLEKNLKCGSQSDQVGILRSYMYITEVLTHGYQMIIAAHMARYQQYQESFESAERSEVLKEVKDLYKKFKNRMTPIIVTAKWAIEESSRDIRPCDSKDPKLNITYRRLNHFARVQLMLGKLGDTKYYEPKEIFKQPIKYRECEPSDFDKPHSFYKGNMSSCDSRGLTGQLTVYTDPKDSGRKYSYFTIATLNNSLERYGTPPANQLESIVLKIERECGIKMCNVFEGGQVKFSTKAVQAQIGYVVTGIRWRVLNEIIYMQIQEGKFENIVSVDPKTVHWKDIEIHGRDENVITLNETQRAVILDDSILQVRSYVTGVQLILLDGKMSLMVIGSEANKSGDRLKNYKKSYALRSKTSDLKELELNNGDIPERAPKNQLNMVVGEPGEYYVRFQPSDRKADAGQTTIPYLDVQEVVTYPHAPIGGIGIYFKQIKKFGGFLGLKLLSPNLEEMVDDTRFNEFYDRIIEGFDEIRSDTSFLPANGSLFGEYRKTLPSR